MLTYQDMIATGDTEEAKMDFCIKAINQHKDSAMYKFAKIADEYNRRQNRTIRLYQKFLYTITGKAVPDNYSANYKLMSGFFQRFITQENQYLLGNGVSWENDGTENRLGNDFDTVLQDIGASSLVCSVAFGFFNNDHIEFFPFYDKDKPCFVPLYDENNGALSAGVRYWQIDENKPLHATLYELDGYTEYIWNQRKTDKNGDTREMKGEILQAKRSYKQKTVHTDADGTKIYAGENYPTFPIVPLWGNRLHQSELVGLQEQIDCYDLIKSGFANTVDDASIIYWLIQNAGGMEDIDDVKLVERLKTLHVAHVDEGQKLEPQQIEAPYQSRKELLELLRKDLYEDAMALDIDAIKSGAVVNAQIKAAYSPLDTKVDGYEYCVIQFIQGILAVAGIEDNPTFTRSKLINIQEEVQTVLMAADYVDTEYITRKILTLLGDGDLAGEVLDRMAAEDIERLNDVAVDGTNQNGEAIEEVIE